MKKKTNGEEEIKPDLKHDTMEFSAATDGDDLLDIDNAAYEEDEIDAEELYAIEGDPDSKAAALMATVTDMGADPDNLPEEDWTEDLPDMDEEEEEADDDEYQR